ncbi:DUF4198 domain-containing protein [Wenzhouxiangella limi]|uniref:DUF4198 domain-containing protein n=1 Tax=Wenzhouxiangella limi TaxID=2707351 RepID=A0A845V390_9GAMM|nr:DUF4198 domain-containing protein [Wenzhouxiangella limi]NDY95696.1 DUF4198 domain-containing protein [Wenzhouxiangella limi]
MTRILAIALIATGFVAGSVHAHHPWVLAEPAQVEPGQAVQVLPYFGHAFPGDEEMAADRLAQATVTLADGQQIALDLAGDGAVTSPPLSEPGVSVIGVRQARGYWTQTTEGGQRLPRSEVANAVRCSYSDNGSKTLVKVGDSGPSAVATSLGHRLEIIPQGEPNTLQAGDTLPVQVLFEGQPHAGPLLAFHSASGEDPYAVLETNADGRTEVMLEGEGPWLLLAHGEIDYPDPSVCDVESFYASLTFGKPTQNP